MEDNQPGGYKYGKVTLKLSGNIYNQFSNAEAHCSLNEMELTGTPLQIGLVYQTLIGLGDNDIDTSADAENFEIYEICNNAIGKETGH